MLNSGGERTPPCGTPVFKLTLFGCVISICCVGFASLDVVSSTLLPPLWFSLQSVVHFQQFFCALSILLIRSSFITLILFIDTVFFF